MKISKTLFALPITAMFFTPFTAVATTSFSFGYDYSTGDYGTDSETRITSIPVSLRFISGGWTTTLSSSLLSMEGDGTVIPGTGGGIVFNDSTSGVFGSGRRSSGTSTSTSSSVETTTESGLGDTSLGVSYGVAPTAIAGAWLDIGVRIKLPTADEKAGLGTGETDYSIEHNGYFTFGRLLPDYQIGYTVTGDSADFEYEDIFYGSLGLGWATSNSTTLGLRFDYSEAAVAGNEDMEQGSVYFSWQASKQWGGSVSYLEGISSTAPDQAITLMLTRTFD